MDLRDLKPFLPDMTEVLTVAVREIVASAYSRPATTPAGPDFLGGTVPSLNQGQHRCPYCATKDVLAPLHADLIRGAAVGPELQGVYQRLAQGKCREALAILDAIPGAPDMDTMRLTAMVGQIDARLSGPMGRREFEAVAGETWTAIALCFHLAERFNAAPAAVDSHLDAVEERLRRIRVADAGVVEGSAVEVR